MIHVLTVVLYSNAWWQSVHLLGFAQNEINVHAIYLTSVACLSLGAVLLFCFSFSHCDGSIPAVQKEEQSFENKHACVRSLSLGAVLLFCCGFPSLRRVNPCSGLYTSWLLRVWIMAPASLLAMKA